MLTGTVVSLTQDGPLNIATVDIGGVGYEVSLAGRAAALIRRGDRTTLYIYTHLRADGRGDSALELFGFESAWEKKVFLMLTSVSGVGFKTALGLLIAVEASNLVQAIMREDKAALTAAPGIGKKTAERMILELKDKAAQILAERPRQERGVLSPTPAAATITTTITTTEVQAPAAADYSQDDAELWTDARQALESLGYKDHEALSALRAAFQESEGKTITVSYFVKNALSHLRTLSAE